VAARKRALRRVEKGGRGPNGELVQRKVLWKLRSGQTLSVSHRHMISGDYEVGKRNVTGSNLEKMRPKKFCRKYQTWEKGWECWGRRD